MPESSAPPQASETAKSPDDEPQEPLPGKAITASRLLALARPEMRSLIWGTIALVIASAMALMYPVVVEGLFDTINGTGAGTTVAGAGKAVDDGSIDRAVILLISLFAIGACFSAIRAYLFTVAGERIVARLRTDLYGAILAQEVGFFDQRRTGELLNRLSSDTTVLQNTVTVNLSMLLRFIVMGIGAVGFLFYTSWRLTLVTLAIIPVVAIGGAVFGRSLRRLATQFQDALAGSTEVAEETISGIRTVRAFAREEQEVQRYGAAVERSFQVAKKRALYIGAFRAVVGFGGYFAIAVVLWYGGHLLADGVITIGKLTSFLLYTLTAAFSIAAIAGLYEDFMKALGASQRIFEIMDRAPEVSDGDTELASHVGKISFDDVHFHYPTRSDIKVLDGLNLTLSPGEVVALVGPSGGGKSTVAALMSRFYDPQEGEIRIDDHPYRSLSPDWIRRTVGVVSQEPILFATSITDNIRYGRPTATDEEVKAAAKAANADEFILSFPEGYDTMVGERGIKLSGGQKQRVAIARALLKDPRVLVLDEATSALDAESEHLVQEALDRLMHGRTTLIIAHRLSTVRDANRVLVLNGGKVVQRGSHDELVEVDGLYRRLVERQFAA